MKPFFFVFFLLLAFISKSQKLDTITTYDYDTSTHEFVYSTQQTFGYNGACFLTRYQINFWDATNNIFGKYFRTTNSLLANNATSQSLSQIWDDVNSKWENYRRGIYTYTTNPKLPSSVLNQNYNTTTSTWVNYDNNIYSYDANGNDTSILTQSWINNSWVNNFYYKYYYDNQGNIIKFEQFKWQNNNWINYYQIVYAYNNFLKLISDSASKWNNNNWQNVGYNTYQYNNNNNLVNNVYLIWDTSSNLFKPYLQYTYTFDVNGNKDSTITCLFNNSNGFWDTLSLDVYHYNGCALPLLNITLTAIQKQNIELKFKVSDIYKEAIFYIEKSTDGFTFHSIKKIESYQDDKLYFDNYDLSDRVYYRIKAVTNDGLVSFSNIAFIENKKINQLAIKVYPNPTQSTCTIYANKILNNAMVTIFNTYGKPLIQQSFHADTKILNLSSLPKGVYILKVASDFEEFSTKLMIQ